MNDFNSPQKFKMRFQKNHQEYANKELLVNILTRTFRENFAEPRIK